ncbi:dermonecrotic toxin domain-containing protein [Pseudomonas sp. PSKL.D1]|uniref:dermonecrotic toxin domain-containing protein n=1 Tax=Pseudomonas sp. PSKL.D1 TaxID=3029060 RepID=UPI002380E33D|nr:DUF6543 domain-containing protein [Pseudomonas sp. PSKL.D1]WDY59725.1 NEL-type E3 ubiquitin ligase domain-containing protein [Pseudomonas sp. PSKL.D1]
MSTLVSTTRPADPALAAATHDFIAARLPAWLSRASVGQIRRLRASFTTHQSSQARLRAMNLALQPPAQFAVGLFKTLFATPLPAGVELEQLEWLVVQPWIGRLGSSELQGFGYRASRSAGLLRLMANFEAGSTYYEGSGLVAPGRDQLLSANTDDLISACRKLDVGGQYQTLLNTVFNTLYVTTLSADKRSGLALAAEIAALKGDIGSDVQLALREVANEQHHLEQSGLRGYPGALEVLGHFAGDGMIIRLRDVEQQLAGVVLYLPSDPVRALRHFADDAAMYRELVKLLGQESYRQYFSQLIALEHRAAFVSLLKQRLSDPAPDLQIKGKVQQGSIFDFMAAEQVQRVKDDARLLLVPTAQADATASLARHKAWKAMGLNLINLAGLFIPVVGAILLGQMVVQTLSEVFEGVMDWQEGHRHEALEHLLNIAETVALTGLTAVGVTAGRNAFVESLVPVTVEGNQQRLWAPDLEHYASSPEDIALAGNGLYSDGSQHWFRWQGRYLEVHRPDADGPYRLRHPQRAETFGPVVLHNGERGWRLMSDRPQAWSDTARMLDVLWPQHPALEAGQAAQVLQVAGVDEDELRGILVDNMPAPVNLRETLRCFQSCARIERFFEHVEGKSLSKEDEGLLIWCEKQPDVGQGWSNVLASKQALRKPLLAHLTNLPLSTDPLSVLLRRDFPGLGEAYGRALTSEAGQYGVTGQTGKLPEALAQRVPSLLRMARMNRMLAGLYLPGAYTNETGQLVFALMAEMQPESVDLALHEGSFDGRRIARVSAEGESVGLRVLVHQTEGFALYEANGERINIQLEDPGDVFEAVMAGLSSAQLSELGMKRGDPPSVLRHNLVEHLPDTHDTIARMLGWADQNRWFNPGRRLDDGRVGYPLDGAPQGNRTPAELLRDALQRYFPGLSVERVGEEVQRMLAGAESVHQLLLNLQSDYQQVLRSLNRWVGSELNGARRQARQYFADQLQRAWGAQGQALPREPGGAQGLRVVLNGSGITTLPEFPLQIDFSYLTSLVISGTAINELTTASLRAFTALRELNLSGNQLLRVPEGIGYLTELRRLRLSRNRIRLDAVSLQRLQGLPRLTHLDLSYNALGQYAFRYSRLPHLVNLNLRACGLVTWPEGIELCGFLEYADMRDNQLGSPPQEMLQMPYDFRRAFEVSGNRLSGASLQRLFALDSLPEEEPTSLDTPLTAVEVRDWWVGTDPASMGARGERWDTVTQATPGLATLLAELVPLENYSWPRAFMIDQAWQLMTLMETDDALARQVGQLLVPVRQNDNASVECFSQLLLRMTVSQAEVAANRGSQLVSLGRSLFRLDWLDVVARQDISRRIQAREAVDRVSILLSYRVQLRLRLGLPGQPHAIRAVPGGEVTAEQALIARRSLRASETVETLAPSLCRRTFWQRFLPLHDTARFDELRQVFELRRSSLEAQRAQVGEAQYQLTLEEIRQDEVTQTYGLRLQVTREYLLGLERGHG